MRVHVVGTSGSGKTTFARHVADRLGVAHVELDSIRHQANWQDLPDDEFRRRVAVVAAADAWVVDGNYAVVRDALWARATHIVFLDLPRWLVVLQVTQRTASRTVLRTRLWNGNRELWRFLLQRDNIIRWAWSSHGPRRAQYGPLIATDPRWVVLRSRREARAWLEALPRG